MKKALTATALAAAMLAGGAAVAGALYKDVQLTVDGQAQQADGFALTVADVLSAKGILLAEGDVVTPAVEQPVTSGQTIEVQFRKELTLEVDGESRTFTTTAATLSEALDQPSLTNAAASLLSSNSLPDLTGARFDAPLSTQLPREGIIVEVSTPKDVTLVVAGEKSQVTTTAPTVADLLNEQELTLGSEDQLTPAAEMPVEEGAKIVLDWVLTKTDTKTEAVKFKVVEKSDSSLWKGETKVLTAGVAGKAIRTYAITTVNGKVTKKVVTKEIVKKKATNQVLAIGTKTDSNGVGINMARAAMWDKIARCESGGNWHINTGNGYYGGLQFSIASWNSNGGRDFAAKPHQASRAEQITVANRYYAKAGTRPWSCA